MRLSHRTGCDNGPCPNVFDTDRPPAGGEADGAWAAVQGKKPAAGPQELLATAGRALPDDEVIGLVPCRLLDEYAVTRHTAGRPDPGMEPYDHCFDEFRYTVTRLEVQQSSVVAEETERLAAFRANAPRPERSVRTSPWLARIAASTIIQGKQWRRIRVIQRPLTPYLKYQVPGYVESQAAGDEVLIADATGNPDLLALHSDFFLFDAGTENEFALLVRYDDMGRFTHMIPTTRRSDLDRCNLQLQLAQQHAVPLNEWLATDAEARTAA